MKAIIRTMLGGTASAVFAVAAQAQTGPIKVGIVQAQTGALADAFGIPTMEGALLAMEQINAKGGIGGRRIEAVVRDDRTSIQPTVIATQEIAREADLVAMIGPSTSGAAMAIRSIINENKIPELTVAYGTALTRENFQYFYRVGPSLDMGNQALLNAVRKARGDGQKLATLSLSDAGGNEGSEDAIKRAPSFGMTSVANEKYKYGDTDFTAQLTRIKASGATALLSLTQGIATNGMIRAVKQLGIQDLMIVGPNGLADGQSQSLAGDLINGVVFWDYVCLDDPDNRSVPALKAAYEERFKKPMSPGVVNGFDMMRMIGAGLQMLADEKKPVSREALNDKLNTMTFDGIGTRYEFTADWHNGPRLDQIPVCTYQGGKRIPWKS